MLFGAIYGKYCQGLSHEETSNTNYLNKNPHFPCTVVNKRYRSACYFYQTSRMVNLFDGDFKKIGGAGVGNYYFLCLVCAIKILKTQSLSVESAS